MKSSLLVFAVIAFLPVAPPGPDLDVMDLSSGPCNLDGTATSQVGKVLNRGKNRYIPPKASQMDTTTSLAALLAPGDDVTRFDDAKGARLIGYVIEVKPGGKETCNCKADDPLSRDTHIEIGLSEDAPPTQRVIVEVTPRLRRLMREASPSVDWSTAALRSGPHGIKHKWVEVGGWLLFDSMHINNAENTNPGAEGNWRATCWELHPVTSLRILPHPPLLAAVTEEAIAGLQAAHAQHVRESPMALAQLRARNQQVLSKFDPDELEEDGDDHP